jgi:hypothetical protein
MEEAACRVGTGPGVVSAASRVGQGGLADRPWGSQALGGSRNGEDFAYPRVRRERKNARIERTLHYSTEGRARLQVRGGKMV